jgi:signal peptidase II
MWRRRAVVTTAIIALLVIAADQAAKAWARGSLTIGKETTVINGWLWFRLARNSGATLGLLSGFNLLFAAFSLLIALAVVVIVARAYVTNGLGIVALGAIAGGDVSNLIDRVRLGGVTDFIEVHLWPTDFNLADAAIRIGAVLFVLALVLEMRRRPRPAPRSGPAR